MFKHQIICQSADQPECHHFGGHAALSKREIEPAIQ